MQGTAAAGQDPALELLARSAAALGPAVEAALVGRAAHGLPAARAALAPVYGTAADGLLAGAVPLLVAAAAARSPALRAVDAVREEDPGWFGRPRMVGYTLYVDRFAGTLDGVAAHLDHLVALGVTYVHLMPLLRSRPGDSDGGYAVVDYDSIEPELGTMADLERLAGLLRERGMVLCLDLVLNHTAAEHPWAAAARAGDPEHRRYYHIFPDRTMPDRFEQTLVEVFPERAPGSFTEVPGLGWVWTTFNRWQWDLDWSEPAVPLEMLRILLALANRGVDVLRLDAVPFLWKRVGTDCQNQPEVHALLRALRALVTIVAPGVAFKAEAIVPPDQLVAYLGNPEAGARECDLAYHSQLMVLLWSMVAERRAGLARAALRRLAPAPATTAWVTYVRCHDDIGWAVADVDAAAAGLDGAAHRAFLSDFYTGRFPGSFARGLPFQVNPRSGDARVSGTAAALCGIEDGIARGDSGRLRDGVRRLLLLYAIAFSFGGVPLIAMGDELGLGNDMSYLADPARAADNRWAHRPRIDWSGAGRRPPGSIAAVVYDALARLAAIRAGLEALDAAAPTDILDPADGSLLAYRRRPARGPHLVGIANLAEEERPWDDGILGGRSSEAEVIHGSDPGWVPGDPVPGLGWFWVRPAT